MTKKKWNFWLKNKELIKFIVSRSIKKKQKKKVGGKNLDIYKQEL